MRLALPVLVFFLSTCCLGACDVGMKSQIPSHEAVLKVSPERYSELLSTLDGITASYGLTRADAAAGLDKIHGREVLFAAYEAKDPSEWRGALDVSDVMAPGEVLLRVYGDYFDDIGARKRFVGDISDVVRLYGGVLTTKDSK